MLEATVPDVPQVGPGRKRIYTKEEILVRRKDQMRNWYIRNRENAMVRSRANYIANRDKYLAERNPNRKRIYQSKYTKQSLAPLTPTKNEADEYSQLTNEIKDIIDSVKDRQQFELEQENLQ